MAICLGGRYGDLLEGVEVAARALIGRAELQSHQLGQLGLRVVEEQPVVDLAPAGVALEGLEVALVLGLQPQQGGLDSCVKEDLPILRLSSLRKDCACPHPASITNFSEL
jgi:hypothetical protein